MAQIKQFKMPLITFDDIFASILIILLSPFAFLALVAGYIFSLAPLVLTWIYELYASKPKKRLNSGPSWYLFEFILFIVSIPMMILVSLWVPFVFIFSHLCAIPWALFTLKFFNGVVSNNFVILKPYLKHGSLSFGDLSRAIIGVQFRQGFCEFWLGNYTPSGFASAFIMMPIYKYIGISNPFIWKLEEKFINQWTEPFPALSEKQIIDAILKLVTWVFHKKKIRQSIDDHVFAAYYPLASKGRKKNDVIGGQFSSSKTFLLTESKHVAGLKNSKSKTAETQIFEVYLYYLNPFHLLTGYVEINYRRDTGLEHPMWCIVGKGWIANWLYREAHDLFITYADDVTQFVYDHQKQPTGKIKAKRSN